MQIKRLFLVTLAVLISLVASITVAQTEILVKDNPTDYKPQSFSFKGFYLGMSIDDACKILNEKLHFAGDKNQKRNWTVKKGANDRYEIDDYIVIEWANGFVKILTKPNEKAVDYIHFSGVITCTLTKSSDMSLDAFAQEFVNAYKIPQLKRGTFRDTFNREGPGWFVSSDEGWDLTIEPDKGILLKKIPKKEERKFD